MQIIRKYGGLLLVADTVDGDAGQDKEFKFIYHQVSKRPYFVTSKGAVFRVDRALVLEDVSTPHSPGYKTLRRRAIEGIYFSLHDKNADWDDHVVEILHRDIEIFLDIMKAEDEAND